MMLTKRITRNTARQLTKDNKTPSTDSSTNRSNHHHTASNPSDFQHNTERFNDDYDDSSDEEDIDDKMTHYDADDNWDKAQKRQTNQTKKALSNDKFLSFVAHAAGLKLLYSKMINKEYYPLKKKLLGETAAHENASLQLQTLVRKTALDVADKSLQQLKKFIEETNQHQIPSAKINAAIISIKAEFTTEIEKIIHADQEKLIAHLFSLKYSTTDGKSEYVKSFESQAHELLLSIAAKKLIVTGPSLDRVVIKDKLLSLANENIVIISSKFKFDSLENSSGKEYAITLLQSYTGSYNNLANQLIAVLKKSQSRGHVSTIIAKTLENTHEQLHLIKSYLNDLKILNVEDSKQNKLSIAEQEALNNYYTFNNDSVRDEISDAFTGIFHMKLTHAFDSFSRPSLGKSHLFVSNNPSSFYANIRLSNRSQKRQTANLYNSLFAQDSVARMWRLSEKLKSDTDVVEMQDILGSSFGRRDFVIGVGNYKKIHDSIVQLKEYLSDNNIAADDCQIAKWIRSIFKGTPPDLNLLHSDQINILHKLQSIAYLLFGCEVTRNPAMAVVNQMMIDLIITNSDWTFKEAFSNSPESDGRLMPMAPEGAVAAARSLEDSFRKYMPYPYHYRGIEDRDGNDGKITEQELSRFEARIVREWLNQLVTPPVKMPGNHNAQWLLTLIEKHFNEWLAPANSESVLKHDTSRTTQKNI